MSRSETKSNRLREIETLLLSHPEGMRQAEIARRLGVSRSVINRYLPDLPRQIYINDDDKRWKIDRESYLVNIPLSLNEALALHLAARLLATRTDRQNSHAAAALRKLGGALKTLAPRISQHMLQSADGMDNPQRQRQDPVYLRALEQLTLGWAEQRKVKLWHRHEDDTVVEYVFCPYFIEPYATGLSTYAFGWCEPKNAIRNFKIERLERVEVLRETYVIPEDFNPQELLRDAWGIWFTGLDPVEVVLKFSPRAAKRVGETRWHRSEQVSRLEDGSLLWRASIAEPQEMMPWIRGWGADVEVIAPEKMRGEMMENARRMAEMYGREKK